MSQTPLDFSSIFQKRVSSEKGEGPSHDNGAEVLIKNNVKDIPTIENAKNAVGNKNFFMLN